MGIITQLDVVNDMLGLLGEGTVNSLTDGHSLVSVGLSRLRVANAREQGRGWWFNTEQAQLQPDNSGEVLLPEDTLKLDPTDTSLQYAQRGRKLYNLASAATVSPWKIGTPVVVTLVRLIPFDDLPAPAQLLVSLSAQLDFSLHMDGDAAKIALLRDAYRDAKVDLMAEHTRSVDANLLHNPSFLATFGRIAVRRGPAGRLPIYR